MRHYWKDPQFGIEHWIRTHDGIWREYGALLSRLSSKHEKQEKRWQTIADGRRQLRWQCLLCGQFSGHPLRKAEAIDDTPEAHLTTAECFQREYQEAQNEFWRSLASQQEQADQDWWACYNAYLRPPAWRKIRDRVLERDGYLCQGCHDRTATIAHHLTYAHVGREFLFDLVALCRDCHERFHRQDGREMSGLLSVEEYEFQATFTDD